MIRRNIDSASSVHPVSSNGARFFVLLLLVLCVALPKAASADVTSADVANRQAQLQAQLDQIENEIAQQTTILQAKQTERQSLERDVSILDAQIQKSKLSIKARDLNIQQLNDDIGTKADTITALDEKLSLEKDSLAAIFRKSAALDNATIIELLLSSKSVSEFFQDVDNFAAIKVSLNQSFSAIADTRTTTSQEKAALEDKKTQEEQLRQLQIFEQQKIIAQEKERQSILAQTKGQEVAYQKIIRDKQKNAAQIRSELFTLRDSAAIPFGTALDLASYAAQKTGVRAALILGVLKQETQLGANLGTGSYVTDMHPTRDVPVYLVITSTLGYDAGKMPVSKAPGYGWGGAMGPGQFIPSTWACYGGFVNVNTGKCGAYKGSYQGPWQYQQSSDIIRRYTGKATPSDPWDNKDAFLAVALLMKENGATNGTAADERLAALRYFAGYGNANKPAYAFYGDGVMDNAAFFQNQITLLGG